jgi:hypothetical protein
MVSILNATFVQRKAALNFPTTCAHMRMPMIRREVQFVRIYFREALMSLLEKMRKWTIFMKIFFTILMAKPHSRRRLVSLRKISSLINLHPRGSPSPFTQQTLRQEEKR